MDLSNEKKKIREDFAKKGLYHCKICKQYLPRQFFVFNKLGKFQLRPECHMCRHVPTNCINMVCKLKLPDDIKNIVKSLSLHNKKPVLDIVLELIIKGLSNEHNKQKGK